MRTVSTRVLLVAQDPGFARSMRDYADGAGDLDIISVSTLGDALASIAATPPDALIATLDLPDSEGLETLRRARAALSRETPIVVIGGGDDPELVQQAIEAGAQDYVVTTRADPAALLPTLQAAIQRSSMWRRLVDSEAALRDSEARKTAVLDSAFDAIFVMNADGTVLETNAVAERMFGFSRADAIGRDLFSLIAPPARAPVLRADITRGTAAPSTFVGRRVELEAVRVNGEPLPIELSIARVQTPGGAVLSAWIRDLTE